MSIDEAQAEQRLSSELAGYVGRWVAVSQHRVVADAPSLVELFDVIDGWDVDRTFEVIAPETAACFF